jgi:hypothetical protein
MGTEHAEYEKDCNGQVDWRRNKAELSKNDWISLPSSHEGYQSADSRDLNGDEIASRDRKSLTVMNTGERHTYM